MCRCVSIMPGMTMPPEASISRVPSGTASAGPTAAIRSPVTSTSAPVSTWCASSIVSTVAFRNTTGRPGARSASDVIAASRDRNATDSCPHDGHLTCEPKRCAGPARLSRGTQPVSAVRTTGPDRATVPSNTVGGMTVARRDSSPDFIEAIARGLDVIRVFQPRRPVMPLSAVAEAAGLARPTARRILLTLEQLGYVRTADGGFELTPRVLDLGMSYVLSRGLWEIARPHMEKLVARTHESSSIAQLDGSDIVYVARVAVPKIIALAVTIGTRFPAMQTSLGKIMLAALPPEEAERVLAEPSRSGITARWQPDAAERAAALREVRARGWSLTDEQLAPGIRSVAAPLRDGEGRTIAALNVTVHAAETPVDKLTAEYLPWLLQTASAISADWSAYQGVPHLSVGRPA